MNDLNLICFLFLARTKNLSMTANELSLSENTVLRNIEKLEEEFSYPLFQKNIGRVRLTVAGEYYYDVFRKFESKLRTMLVSANNSKNKEELHIVWSSWIGCPDWLEDMINGYAELNPDLEIRLINDSINDIPGLFERREVDVVFSSIYMSRYLASQHHTLRLEERPIFLAVSEHHLLSGEKQVSPQFSAFPNLTVPIGEESPVDTTKRVNEFHVPLGYLPKHIALYDNWNSVYIDVALGNGVCVTPENEMLKNNENIRLIPTGRTVTFAVSWMNSTTSRHTRLFTDYILQKRGCNCE